MAWVQRGVKIIGEAADEYFGYSTSISSDGTIVAIGATGNDGNGTNAGRACVYAWNAVTSTWVQRGAEINGDAANDYAGTSVSLSSNGSVLAIGAYGKDVSAIDVGHVRVYTWNATTSTWDQRGVDINGEAEYDYSGSNVSLSSDGSVVAIGATGNDGTGADAGHVRVYAWSGSAWVQRGADIDGEAAGDYSGYSVSLSSDGSVVAIGAVYNDGTTGVSTNDRGSVRVYAWSGSAWIQRGADIDGEAAGDKSGWSVSLSSNGTVVAIGAPYNDGNGTNMGHARIYAWNAASSLWVQRGADIDGDLYTTHYVSDQSGWSVSLSSDGTVVAIGAINGMEPTVDGISFTGRVRVYTWDTITSTWIQRGTDLYSEYGGEKFGWSVSLSSDGSIVAIGAINDFGTGKGEGSVRVYRYPVPYTPTDLSGTPGNQTAQISFTAGDNGGSAITNYMYSTNGGSTFTAFSSAQTTSPVTISGLNNGTQYSIQLKAVNANGSSAASATVTVTPAAPAPSGGGSGGGSSGGGGGGGGIPCIPAGQRILTPQGYKPVETLKQGDLIQTSDGRSIPVRLYSTTIEKTTEETAPIRIGASLLLSPMHAFKVNKRGWMIPKLAVLKNLYDAKQEPLGETIMYYHVETANYLRDNLVVEGTVVEGYGKTFAKTHNLSVKDIYKRSKNGPWLERISSVPTPKAKN
jgi:hypothetical protein